MTICDQTSRPMQRRSIKKPRGKCVEVQRLRKGFLRMKSTLKLERNCEETAGSAENYILKHRLKTAEIYSDEACEHLSRFVAS